MHKSSIGYNIQIHAISQTNKPMAIDLTKLEKKFIDLFANVTQEEFEQWLLTKNKPMAQQTAVEWLVNHWKKLQSKGEKMSWQQIINITELAKQREKEQKEEEYKRGWEDATSTGIKEAHKYQ